MTIRPVENESNRIVRTRKTAAREVILYGGRSFSCTPDMARIFLRRAREVIERGDEQLVPLLHVGGIELLLVTRAMPYSLVDTIEE